ncbi:MAG: hypothetical protein QME96_03750 [Myxococcota bacterium]|nr:hypothetical protein [Myxococcota bacterium]
MKAAAAVVAFLGGCGTELPPQSLVDGFRILAVRSDPPHAAPGERVRVEALIADPGGEGRSVVRAWIACLLGPGGDMDRCRDPGGGAIVAFGAGAVLEFDAPDVGSGDDPAVAIVTLAACAGGGACSTGSTQACSNSCGVAGSQTCSGTCAWGQCCAPSEVCGNACDDNCNGVTNEGCGPPNDTCTGATAISLGVTYTGAITGAANDYSAACGATNGPDVVYSISHPGGDLFVGVLSTAFNPTAYVATSCGSSTYCNDNAYAGVNASVIVVNNLAAGTYYVVVDSPAGSSGDFTIETYRNGNWTAGDMCGEPLRLFNGVTGDTCASWVYDDYSASCASDCYDIVYYFVKETAASAVTISSCGSGYDSVIFLRDDCDNGSDLACNDDDGPSCTGTRASIRPTLGPGIYFAFMDGFYGFGCSCGSFTLSVSGL